MSKHDGLLTYRADYEPPKSEAQMIAEHNAENEKVIKELARPIVLRMFSHLSPNDVVMITQKGVEILRRKPC